MSDTHDDACWRRIGIYGDRSCPELVKHIQCFNCPVTSRAAAALLDREDSGPTDPSHAALESPRALSTSSDLPVLVFRIGDERFSIPCADAVSVEPLRAVVRLPHRSARGFRGLCNVHGQLRPCAALDAVLGVAAAGASREGARRLLVVERNGSRWAFEADEVIGTARVEPAALVDPPATVALDAAGLSRARFLLDGNWVALLDSDRLFRALEGTLS